MPFAGENRSMNTYDVPGNTWSSGDSSFLLASTLRTAVYCPGLVAIPPHKAHKGGGDKRMGRGLEEEGGE
jgi:hypothetical protein